MEIAMGWSATLTGIVALLAIVFYLFVGVRVGAARQKYNIQAPAITGHPDFERVFRVQQNTLELLPAFLVGLYFFSTSVSGLGAAAIGLLWILGRVAYMNGYIADPSRRRLGAIVSFATTIALVAGGLIGLAIKLAQGLSA
jgi:glutathione S-transferase